MFFFIFFYLHCLYRNKKQCQTEEGRERKRNTLLVEFMLKRPILSNPIKLDMDTGITHHVILPTSRAVHTAEWRSLRKPTWRQNCLALSIKTVQSLMFPPTADCRNSRNKIVLMNHLLIEKDLWPTAVLLNLFFFFFLKCSQGGISVNFVRVAGTPTQPN